MNRSSGNEGTNIRFPISSGFSCILPRHHESFKNKVFINHRLQDTYKHNWGITIMAVKKGTGKYKDTEIEIVNIVVSTSMDLPVPLEKMAATLSNTEYNPEQFPGLVIRIKDPKTSALIFSSGNVVCTGARNMPDVDRAIQEIIKSLGRIGVDVKVEPQIRVQNIVASGSIGMKLNLNVLAMRLENTEYEPEQFPGLVYKLYEKKATFLLFSNGKVVCTGTKSESEVDAAMEALVDRLEEFK